MIGNGKTFGIPFNDVVDFKKEVYSAALNELWQFVEAKN